MCCRDKHAVLSRHVLQQYVAPPSRESHGHSGRLHRTILLQAVSRSLHFLQPLLIRWYKFRNSRVNEKVFTLGGAANSVTKPLVLDTTTLSCITIRIWIYTAHFSF